MCGSMWRLVGCVNVLCLHSESVHTHTITGTVLFWLVLWCYTSVCVHRFLSTCFLFVCVLVLLNVSFVFCSRFVCM